MDKFLAPNEVVFDPNILKSSVFIILVGAGINTFSSYISSQDVVQRFTTTTDIKELRKMTFGNGFLSIGTTTVIYLIGTALFVFIIIKIHNYYKQHNKTKSLHRLLCISYQLGSQVFYSAAIYAASQSTLSTGLNSVATSWVLDIQGCFRTKFI